MRSESCPTGEMAGRNEGRQVGAARRHSGRVPGRGVGGR
jgi:hypothetical protein